MLNVGRTWDNGISLLSVDTGTRGIEISPFSELDADPTSGTGGIEITQIGGQAVPEPSSIILLMSYMLLSIFQLYWKNAEGITNCSVFPSLQPNGCGAMCNLRFRRRSVRVGSLQKRQGL